MGVIQEGGHMDLDRSKKGSLDRLATLEGEIWARRLLDQLTTWDGPVESDWPGRLEDARALAAALVDGPRTQEALAVTIHQRAQAVWGSLVLSRNGTSPTPP